MEASDSLPEFREWIFFIPFPFPNFGNGFFSVPFPFPNFGNGFFQFPSRSRILKSHSRSPLFHEAILSSFYSSLSWIYGRIELL